MELGRFRFIAFFHLSGTRQRKGVGKTQPFRHLYSHLLRYR